ncbi:HEAT repeat-containing protein 1 [Physocladia obscura]|uniref:U3 small nucleolar RNA-associated protein 10 n=1 Tax=Physocladia obscura TaxID=109957 RepID=A0AAD5XDY0_9FUNG|nr:HEAT repeat-containing protein 1 [Physocladia obscura]
MATSLAQQLGNLAATSSGARNQGNKAAIASLVFATSAEAAQADLDTDGYFALGVSGLAGLSAAGPSGSSSSSFEAFATTLFSDALKRTDRMLLNPDEAASLDRLVERFLACVSPLFLHPAAFKALEWLVHRFHIHEHNSAQLLRAALPFHDSWQFVRVVRILALTPSPTSASPSMLGTSWAWIKQPIALDRASLVRRAVNDKAMLGFVCEMIDKLLLPDASNAALCSFFSAFMVDYLNAAKISDNAMRIIMPCLFAMASTSIPNVQSTSYIILAHLSNKVPFSQNVIVAMIDLIVSFAKPDLAKFAVCCLISLYDSQDSCPNISIKSLESILGDNS